jgi:hypothetical protein
MALLPSHLLLRIHALLLLTSSYFLLTSPLTLLSSPIISILGGSMHIHPAQFQPSINPLTSETLPLDTETVELLGCVALLLAGYGSMQLIYAGGLAIPSNLTSTSTNTRGLKQSRSAQGENLHTLLSLQSLHLSFSTLTIFVTGVLTAWIYLFHSERNLLSGMSDTSSISKDGSLGSVLGNQVVFSASLIEMLFHGYLWTVVREERREVLQGVAVRRKEMEEDDE